MSHIVSIKTKLLDAAAVNAACRRLGLEEPTSGTAELFSGQAAGLLVKLPGWIYPAVIDTTSGEVKFDNYNQRWNTDLLQRLGNGTAYCLQSRMAVERGRF